MVGYIKEIADDIVKVQSPTAALNLVRALSEEINRLDPREFVPAGQSRFVKLRMRAADIARAKQLHLSNLSGVIAFGQEAREVLDLYAGVAGYANLRSFAFVTDIAASI